MVFLKGHLLGKMRAVLLVYSLARLLVAQSETHKVELMVVMKGESMVGSLVMS
jgi:hypothetical protein